MDEDSKFSWSASGSPLDDIIPSIMAHWGGHRLGLTCRRWLGALRAENYVTWVEEPSESGLLTFWELPNSVKHGKSIHWFQPQWTCADLRHVERRIYHHGACVEDVIEIVVPERTLCGSMKFLVRGYACVWRGSTPMIIHDADNVDLTGGALGIPEKTDAVSLATNWLALNRPTDGSVRTLLVV